VGSSPYNDGTAQHRQMARARQARQKGVTKVNQWLNPHTRQTGANLVDAGRVQCASSRSGRRLRSRFFVADQEATRKACGVLVAKLQGKSWAPALPTGLW
jgi:hypothetical protein